MKIFLLLLTALFHLISASTSASVIMDLKELYQIYRLSGAITIVGDKFIKYFKQNEKECFYRLYEYSFKDIKFVNYALGVLREANKETTAYFYRNNLRYLSKHIKMNINRFSEDYQAKIDCIDSSMRLFKRLLEYYEINKFLNDSDCKKMWQKIEKLREDLKKDEFQMRRFSYMNEASSMYKLSLVLRVYNDLKKGINNNLLFETNLNRFYKYSRYLVLNLKKNEILEFLYRKPDDFILLFFYLSTRPINTPIYHESVVSNIITKNETEWMLKITLKSFVEFTGFIIECKSNRISISSDILLDEISLLAIKDIYKRVFKRRLYLLEEWKVSSSLITNSTPIIKLENRVECFLVSYVINVSICERIPVFEKFIFPLITNFHNSIQIKIVIISSLPELINFIKWDEKKQWTTFDSIIVLAGLVKHSKDIPLLEVIFNTIHVLLDNIQHKENYVVELNERFKKMQLYEIHDQFSGNEYNGVKQKVEKIIEKTNSYILIIKQNT